MAKIKLRRDTAANWLDANPILANGETGFETDTRMIKLGNGTTAWADLKYAVTGNLKVTDNTIHGDDVVSVSSGMGDRSNWILTTNGADGSPGNLQPVDTYAIAVAYDSDGNTFSLGGYGGFKDVPQTGTSLTKTDANGQVLFSKYYDQYEAFGYSMIVDGNDDVIFVMGETDASSTDTLLVKVSGTTGAYIWQKYLADTDPTSDDVALCVDVDSSNNVIIAGTTATGGGPSPYDFWVAKFNGSTGAPIWQRQYDSNGCQDAASGIAIDSDGNIGVVGRSYGPGTFLGVFKLNGANGNVLWQKRVINANVQSNEDAWGDAWVDGDLYSSDICVDSNNDFYFNLTGIYCMPDITVSGIHKISSSGDWKWSKVISYANYQSGTSSVICDSDNNVYLTSTLFSNRQVNPNPNNDTSQFATVITKFNSSGRKIWGKSLQLEQGVVISAFSGYDIAYGGQSIAVNDDYILVGGNCWAAPYSYDQNSSIGDGDYYARAYLAQLDKSGTDFVKDGWIYKDNTFRIFDMSGALDDAGFLEDLTNSVADIVVTAGDMDFVVNTTDTHRLTYINTSRVKTMTLDGDRLHLPENGGLALSRNQIGHITSIGKFNLDGDEGNNTGGATWINGVAGGADGDVYAVGGWYTSGYQWNDSNSNEEVPLIWKIDSEGAIVWSAGNNLNQWGADMIHVAHNAATNTIVALGHDNDDSLDNFDGAEGFNLFTLDAGSGTLKDVLHVRPTAQAREGTRSGQDMIPYSMALKSDGTPVVVGYVSSNFDKFANVTTGAAGLTGSGAGILVINKSVFDRTGNNTDVVYPDTSGYWYIDAAAITYVNRYASVASVTTTGTGADATFTVVANPATNAYTVTVSAPGTGYAQGDTVKVIGSLLGGVSPANDAVITVTAVTDGAIDTVSVTGTGQTLRIKLDVGTGTDFTQAGTYNVWHETDSDGFIWTPDWSIAVGNDGGSYEFIPAVTIDSDDNVIVGGRSENLNLGSGTTNWNQSSQTAYIAKYDENGVRQWAKAVDGHEGNNTVWGLTTDADNNVYGVMTAEGGSTYDPSITKLDSNGDFVWRVQLNVYEGQQRNWSISKDSDENIIISGSCEFNDTDTNRVGYNQNILVAKFDKDGNPLWKRLLWSNNGIETGWNDNYANNLAVVGDKFVFGGHARAWNDNDDIIAVVAQLPVDGTGLGNHGNYYYEEIEVYVERWTENDVFGGGVVIVQDVASRLQSRAFAVIEEPYDDNQSSGDGAIIDATGPMTIYADLGSKVAHVLEEGGGDITGVKEIVFEDGTRQSTSSQDIPQVDVSITNRGDDDYWLRLEDRGHHIFMDNVQGVNIVIPPYSSVPFPVGTSIVIVTDDDSQVVYSDGNNDYMISAGADGDGGYAWIIPRYSMATLLKIRQGYDNDGTPNNSCTWMIAGPGLTLAP